VHFNSFAARSSAATARRALAIGTAFSVYEMKKKKKKIINK